MRIPPPAATRRYKGFREKKEEKKPKKKKKKKGARIEKKRKEKEKRTPREILAVGVVPLVSTCRIAPLMLVVRVLVPTNDGQIVLAVSPADENGTHITHTYNYI